MQSKYQHPTVREEQTHNLKPDPSSTHQGPNFSIHTTYPEDGIGAHKISPPDLKLLTLIQLAQEHECSYIMARSPENFFALVEEKAATSNSLVCDNLSLSCTEIKSLLSYNTAENIVISMIKDGLIQGGHSPSLAKQCYQHCTRK